MIIQDLFYITKWWIVLLFLGTISFPTVHLFAKKFFDAGWGLTKIAGIMAISYLTFVSGISKILPLSSITQIILVAAWAVPNLYLFQKNRNSIIKSLKNKRWIIIFSESIFALALLFWAYVRAHHPEVRGLEKFMDLGFVNSILRSNFLPPEDMWFSGEPINYYWFGHLSAAVLTRLSAIPSATTYNLMIASIFALSISGVFSISSTLLSILKINKKTIVFAALVAALLVNLAGNFHAPIYILKDGTQKYWYPDATRFIGYNPDIEDKTIHEFPLYSYVVSDLHAHLLNLPFVILYIAALLHHLKKQKKESSLLSSILLGFILGIMFMTNTWDFLNYSLATVVAFALFYRFNLLKWIKSLIPMATTGVIVFLPFFLNFESITQGAKLVHSRSALWQLAILWGLPAILTTSFLAFCLKHKKKLNTSDIFVLSLLITSIALIIIPEIVYVKDIYAESHYRANTMFKLTYQAFVLSYLSATYVVVRIITSIKNKLALLIFTISSSILIGSLFIYPYFAIKSYYNSLKNYQGLNGESWISQQYPDHYELLNWTRNNINQKSVILDASGDSYTEYNLVSAYSGNPTVLGWFVHEWLWRGSVEAPQGRAADVEAIYTSKDTWKTQELLKKYKVEYVIISSFETKKYPNLYEEKFDSIGELVFEKNTTKLYKINQTK